ncbi:MAG: 2-keto-4-pentenoate hydratase [Pseudomonadota bacterium]
MPSLEKSIDAREPLPSAMDNISKHLVNARMSAHPLPQFPGELPGTLSEAYSIQSASVSRWPDQVSGWKVGGIPHELRESLGAPRLAGPIYRSSVHKVKPGEEKSMRIFDGGFAAVEAEFVFELAETIKPIEREYSDATLIDVVSALHIGAEIASSPMADINRIGPVCVVCDFGNNNGLLVGPSIPDWDKQPPADLTARVCVDGIEVGRASADTVEGGLLQSLRFLITLSAQRGVTLHAGTFVSCGALTGIHDVTTASKADVDFGAFGAFKVRFEAVQPRPDHSPLRT